MTDDDPILEEVYRAREQLWQAAGCNLDKLFEMLRAHQAASGRPTVSLEPKRIPVAPDPAPADK